MRQLSRDVSDEIEPIWSSDGSRIVYSSNQSGNWEIWEQGLSSGGNRQLTSAGGSGPLSLDDAQLLFIKTDQPGLWRLDRASGREALVLADYGPAAFRNSALASDGLYFAQSASGEPLQLVFFSFRNQTLKVVRALEGDRGVKEFLSRRGNCHLAGPRSSPGFECREERFRSLAKNEEGVRE